MTKLRRNIACVAAAMLLLCSFMLCACGAAKDKEFSKAGFTITLTDGFTEQDIVSQTAAYVSTKVSVTALKEELSILEDNDIDADLSLSDYADLVIAANNLDSKTEEKDGLLCFTYNKSVSGKNFTYFATVFKGSDAFWLVQFACEDSQYDALKEDILKYAKSVKVD
ncbi:MAG: hypothetical protein HFE77_03950 [Clostridiales bacterium]|nr:hypothetical protein [Clostridiales bacterium]